MDLSYSPEELAFRQEVRSFIDENLPEHIRAKGGRHPHYSREDIVEWHQILARKGWVASHWPKEYGGPGWTPVQRFIFMEELLATPAPEPLSFNINMLGPVLYTFGNQAQKDYWLPRLRNLDTWFCQGFSEPGAGSDLASLKTRAVRDGDHYVINGQKTWTSSAHWAEWCFLLARTDPAAEKPQKGISMLLVDLKTPGVDVRPIWTIDGHHYTNEVFYDNVRVPVTNLIGEENKGWDYAKFLLGNERTGIARVGMSRNRLRQARMLAAQTETASGETVAQSAEFRRRAVKLEVELKALELTALRVIDAASKGLKGKPDPRSSILKLRGAETQQASAELMVDAAGPAAIGADGMAKAIDPNSMPTTMREADGVMATHMYSRAASIYGGASEIQKNIIAKGVLGF